MIELSSVKVAVSPVEKFQEFLATKGMRLTPEREAIVREVFSNHEHFDADQLVDRLTSREGRRPVSRSTVYRALQSLVDAGLLRKVARPNDREIYEHDYGYPRHDHLICGKCGSLIEFHNDVISQTLEAIAESHGFLITDHRLEVNGVCSKCRRPPTRRHRKLDMV